MRLVGASGAIGTVIVWRIPVRARFSIRRANNLVVRPGVGPYRKHVAPVVLTHYGYEPGLVGGCMGTLDGFGGSVKDTLRTVAIAPGTFQKEACGSGSFSFLQCTRPNAGRQTRLRVSMNDFLVVVWLKG
jgi:hypothetical protein